MALSVHGQAISLRPGLDHKPIAFRRDRRNGVQFTVEAVLCRQENDPPVCQDHLADEGIRDVIVNRLTGPAAGPKRHALRHADADTAARSGPAAFVFVI